MVDAHAKLRLPCWLSYTKTLSADRRSTKYKQNIFLHILYTYCIKYTDCTVYCWSTFLTRYELYFHIVLFRKTSYVSRNLYSHIFSILLTPKYVKEQKIPPNAARNIIKLLERSRLTRTVFYFSIGKVFNRLSWIRMETAGKASLESANVRQLKIPWTTKYVHLKCTTEYVPSSELGIPQTLSRQRVCPSPQNRGEGGGGGTHAGGWGVGESQFRRLEK